jgi:ribosomal protein L11 methylase PrmA
LLLSGILTTRSDEVVRAAALHALRLFDARERGEWWAGVFELSN